ncbi:hypothetical protein [uncultured Tenacibaculum sp.]|uniref:hypothetical protein n=1 Tax=uncultured Tenacibaculum sp. TaxID=174713 RepID=UPI00262865C1|nr:hypothetical protein [uncultured Tenacibaculum sp.]
MEGKEILDSIIGKKLDKGRTQSFVLNGELIEKINLTYLKFDNWISIVSSDELTTVRKVNKDFESRESFGDKEFYYPIVPINIYFPDFEKYVGKKLVSWKELVWNKNNKLSFGINLYFEDNMNLIIHDNTSEERNQYVFKNSVPADLIEK